MAAIDASQYATITIESTVDRSKTVDLRLGVISIDYYEDIFSPTVTAKMVVINTGNVVAGNDNDQTQSLYHGLPLRGGERVVIKIEGNSDNNPGLDFSTDPDQYMYVSSIGNVMSEGERESFVLSLTTRVNVSPICKVALKGCCTISGTSSFIRFRETSGPRASPTSFLQ